MLWYYSDHDDIMMQIEEMNRPIYEPMSKYLERNKIKQKEKEEKAPIYYTTNTVNNKYDEKYINYGQNEIILIHILMIFKKEFIL